MKELKKGFQGPNETPGEGIIFSWDDWMAYYTSLENLEIEDAIEIFRSINYDQLYNQFIPWVLQDKTSERHVPLWYVFGYYEYKEEQRICTHEIGDDKVSDYWGLPGFEHIPMPEDVRLELEEILKKN